MVMNSKEILTNLLANDPEAKAEWDKDFKLKNDPGLRKQVNSYVKQAWMNCLNCLMF